MADRFWVGGTGNWSSTARWSTSDGGGSGASVPGAGDDVYFTANSNSGTGSFTVTVDAGTRACRNFTASGLDGTMTLTGLGLLTIYGSLSIPATNFSWSGTSPTVYFYGTGTITTNGITVNGFIYIMTGAALTLGGALTTSVTIEQQGGTLDLAGYTLTTGTMLATGSNSRSITFGTGGSIVLTGTGTVWQYTGSNFSFTDPANANFTLTNTTTTARTFAGGGLTYGTLTIGGSTGTSTLTISGNNTFGAIASTKTAAHTISFTDSTTQTVGEWTVKGTSGNVVTLQGTSTAGWNLAYTGTYLPAGLDYLSISRCTATPADTWYAGEFSTNGGNNSGWQFMQDPDDFLSFFDFNHNFGI